MAIIHSPPRLRGDPVPDRPRLLLIGPPPGPLNGALPAADVEVVSTNLTEIAHRLVEGGFAAVLAAPEVAAGLLDQFRRDELILGHIDKGLAVLDPSGVVTWANGVLRVCAGTDPVGRPLFEALGGVVVATEEADPLARARAGHPISLRL